MAFSQDVKTELVKVVPTEDHCLSAELMAFLVKDMKERPDTVLYRNACCKRAFLRGIFLACGSLSDPNRTYSLDIGLSSPWLANEVQKLLFSYDIKGKIVLRNNKYVVYLKDGDEISEFLRVIEAPVSLMALENVRVTKDVRNRVNRSVNCETANLRKTVSAGQKQVADIEQILRTVGLSALPDELREMAELRMENPDATLEELGQLLNPPLGKSGVNHRLRRLHEIASSEEMK